MCEDNNVKLLILRLQLSAFHRKGLVIVKMGPTSHGLFISDSESSIVLMAMKRGNLWNSNSHQDTNTENLMKELVVLKKSLSTVTEFDQLNTVEFLMPFLDVIR